MKGFIFTELIQMVEEKFGYSIADELASNPVLPSKGVFTGVGNYPFSEMQIMLKDLHERTQIPISDLLFTYGVWLFKRLGARYPYLIEDTTSAFDLLRQLDQKIHVEIKKLYPESQPPRIITEDIDDQTMKMVYISHRKMGILAQGLIHGCASYFGETVEVNSVEISEDGTTETFLIKKVPNADLP